MTKVYNSWITDDQSTRDELPGLLLGKTVQVDENKENKEKKNKPILKNVGFVN